MNKESVVALKHIYLGTVKVLQIFQLDDIFQVAFGMNLAFFNQQCFIKHRQNFVGVVGYKEDAFLIFSQLFD